MKQLLTAIFLLNAFFSLSQVLTLDLPDTQAYVDQELRLIVARIDDMDRYSDLSGFSALEAVIDTMVYRFDGLPSSLDYESAYEATADGSRYTLYFTELPLIGIESQDSIVDEPKVLGTLTYTDEIQTLSTAIGVELRGGSTLTAPKNTLDIELWQDAITMESRDEKFGDLRSDDDWILDAMYNEPLRMRSFFAHKLWLEMHSLYYKDEEPKAKSGADVLYVELFLNGRYNGVYALSEQLDRKQMKLKSYKEEIRGELYKGTTWGAPTYGNPPTFNNASREWAGYEYKYPKEDEATDWQSVFDFVSFVNSASDEDFVNEIWDRFDYDNYLDYFIFLNVLRATDNTGKNIYLSKYKRDEPYFNVPWDLDGCFGTVWNGEKEDVTNDILTNGFIDRVIELNPHNYNVTVAARWKDYRTDLLSTDRLLTFFEERFDYFKDNKVYEREALVYPNYPFDEESLAYMDAWIRERMSFLDTYFDALTSVVDVESNNKILLYPNPVNGRIYLENTIVYLNEDYKIMNERGQIVMRGKIQTDSISIDRLTSGVYVFFVDGLQSRFVVE